MQFGQSTCEWWSTWPCATSWEGDVIHCMLRMASFAICLSLHCYDVFPGVIAFFSFLRIFWPVATMCMPSSSPLFRSSQQLRLGWLTSSLLSLFNFLIILTPWRDAPRNKGKQLIDHGYLFFLIPIINNKMRRRESHAEFLLSYYGREVFPVNNNNS